MNTIKGMLSINEDTNEIYFVSGSSGEKILKIKNLPAGIPSNTALEIDFNAKRVSWSADKIEQQGNRLFFSSKKSAEQAVAVLERFGYVENFAPKIDHKSPQTMTFASIHIARKARYELLLYRGDWQ